MLPLHETNFVRQLHSASPSTRLVGRHHNDDVALERPQECVDIFWDALTSYAVVQDRIVQDVQGPNQLSVRHGDDIYLLCRIDEELGRRFKEAGYRYWMFSTSERQPPAVDRFNWTRDARFHAAAQHAHGVNGHGYWWPTLSAALASGDPSRDHFPMGDPLRHQRWHAQLPPHLKRLKVLLGETGPDAGVMALPHAGWQTAYDGDPQRAMAEFAHLDSLLRADPTLEAACFFCIDFADSDWWDFALNRNPELMRLLTEHVKRSYEPVNPFAARDVRELLRRHPTKVWARRRLERIDTIVVHHDTFAKPISSERLAKAFVNKGWPAMAYHFRIRQKGELDWCLHLEEMGGHTEGHNEHTLGACLNGCFTQGREPTEEQLDKLTYLVLALMQEVPSIKEIKGHREFKPTACPGGPWLDRWRSKVVPEPCEEWKRKVRSMKDAMGSAIMILEKARGGV